MKIFLLTTLVFVLFLSAGCNDSKPANNNANGDINRSSNAANAADTNSRLEKVADAVIVMPSPNPVANAKKQSFTGITVDVPADWKALKKFDAGTSSGVSFQAPGDEAAAIKVTVGRSYDLAEGDVQTTFEKNVQKKIYSKIGLREIDRTLGILYAELKDDASADYLLWETFPPPDLRGYAVRRYVQIYFPNGTFEQNKQQIADILLSAKIEN